MTKEDIKRIVMNGDTGEYSHVIIWCDTYDFNYSYVYVKYGEDVKLIVAEYNSYNKMRRIMEVYNYNLDLEKQLDEARAYHIEPVNMQREEKEIQANDVISEDIKKAINYATKMHQGQTRKTGEPYIIHPLHVLQNVLKYKKSKNIETLLISACLHDTIEDTPATYYDIVENFGPQVASLVLELTTDEDMKNALGKQQYLSIKMKNMSSWALDIKLCDRLDNVNDLSKCQDESFKNKYLNETIEIIDYLLKNAKLTNTHLVIIEEIIRILIKLCKTDNEKSIKLIDIAERCSKLNNSLQGDEDIITRLIKIANNMKDSDNMPKEYSK